MIDKLLCFDNGYIKFEDNFSRISAAYKPENAYLAFWDKKLFCFDLQHHIQLELPIGKMPDACGIFDSLGTPVFLFGNSEPLKREFALLHPKNDTTFHALENEPKNEVVELDPIIEEKKEASPATVDEGEAECAPDEACEFLEPNTYWQCNARAFLEKLALGEEEKELSTLIPGSRWAKPQDEEYVMGVIFDEQEEPMYLCYGFENVWSETPPTDFEGYSQWIPKNFADPHDRGYWVIYINALTGERVK